jgi:hypothetical protein
MNKKFFVTTLMMLAIILASCLKDEVAPPPDPDPDPEPGEAVLVHYWHFNTMSGETVTQVTADYSAGGLTASLTYPGTGDGYMDARTHRDADPVSNFNLRLGEGPSQGAVLRVRNPADTRQLLLDIPSTGYHSLILTFAATRSENGSKQQQFELSTDGGANWIKVGDPYYIPSLPENEGYVQKVIDLTEYEAANDNPNLKFRFMFVGEGNNNPSGNNRFDNITLDGISIDGSIDIPEAVIVMNEIYSRGDAENPDWIELYNVSSFDADIGGYKIYDNGGQAGSKPKKEIPAGTILPAKSWYVIVVDNATESGFGLSSGGEEVWLENTAGEIIDNVTFPALTETQSYGRYPDGNSNWQILEVVTRGEANDNTIPPAPALIKMNEIYSRGTTENPDWIELYNAGDVVINLTGYKIYDNGGQSGSKPKKVIPEETIILPGGFFVIATEGTGEPSDFGLSSGGEEVWLENADGEVIDNLTFPAMDANQSYGRFPDGSDNWQLLARLTPGAPNSNTPPSEPELIYYWHFNDQKDPNAPIEADFDGVGLSANITYPGTGDGYMDYRTHRPADPVSNFNLRMGQEPDQGAVLRVRNPADTRELLFEIPSSGFSNLVVTYAATRSSNGGTHQRFQYSADGGSNWSTYGDDIEVPFIGEGEEIGFYAHVVLDLSGISQINNNPNLKFRILAVGEGNDNPSGNQRIDNFSVDAIRR